MKYFRLLEDMSLMDRWYLGKIQAINNWTLYSDQLPELLSISLVKDGSEIDFTYTETYVVPIVSSKLRMLLAEVKNIRFVPVQPLGKECNFEYFVMIVDEIIDCIDEEKSHFEKFQNDDPIRPDMAGQYSAFFDMKIDEKKTNRLDIFRIKNFDMAIIVSENVVNVLNSKELIGLKFKPVN